MTPFLTFHKTEEILFELSKFAENFLDGLIKQTMKNVTF